MRKITLLSTSKNKRTEKRNKTEDTDFYQIKTNLFEELEP